MPSSNRPPNRRTTAPKTKVSLDLDKLDAEGDAIEPFTARINGKVFTFADPGDMGYFDLTSVARTPDGEESLLRKVLGDQYDDFVAAGPTTRQVMKLFTAWRDHYGMLDPGEALASVATSNGTE
jgi:hypothetical protein